MGTDQGGIKMQYTKDAPFADVFLCDGDLNFHDYYYISSAAVDEESIYYRVNRAGIESRVPNLFVVERNKNMKCCEIFCVFSGKGKLVFRGRTYRLEKNQIVVLPAGESHAYTSDDKDPLGMSWVEFYGGDSNRLTRHIVNVQGPVIEGAVFADTCAAVGILQQKLMIDEKQNVSPEVYHILFGILKNEERYLMSEILQDVKKNFMRAEAFIDAHLKDKITNRQLAEVCGISVPYFIQQFKKIYRMTPQEYVMRRRVRKGRNLLINTRLSVDEIADSLGFCNASHFIRRFKEAEGMTPVQYRDAYVIHGE